MIKACPICGHTGELTWRDGKYYCAMCGTMIPETDPVVQPQAPVQQPQVQQYRSGTSTVNNVTCPICKNQANNLFDGVKYRCSLCGTQFDRQPEYQESQYNQYNSYGNPNSYRVQELKKQKDKYLGLGVLFLFIFWPVGAYFFYKMYQTNNELKSLGY